MPDDSGQSVRLRRQIADILGLPVEAFLTDVPATAMIARHDQSLRLWSALDRPTDRPRVLEVMRTLASGTSDT